MKTLITFISFFILLIPSAHADWKESFVANLKNGGVYVEDQQGQVLLSHRIDDSFIPASTLKVATAACALHELGSDFRFSTEIYSTPNNGIAIKGYGDPLLVSEELKKMARAIQNHGIKTVNSIVLDTSYFAPDIVIDGTSQSSNPYDALNSALLANFNTIYVQKLKNGQVISAEPQTPITPIAIELGKKLRGGKQRINLAKDKARSVKYVGELLAAFLKQEGVQVSDNIKVGLLPDGSNLIYENRSSLPLSEVIKGMLEFSTNLTANQILLVMGAHKFGAPATVNKGVQVLEKFLKEEVKWTNFKVMEGSGLSRGNAVTPTEMMQLLDYFKPNWDLLPVHDQVFHAKTGTLNGVNTYFGYMDLPDGNIAKYVILVNSPVPFDYKFSLAKQLYRYLSSSTMNH